MTNTPLVRQIANQIVDYINSLPEPAGVPLSERMLATRLRVSRGPVRKALQLLHEGGLVEKAPGGGFVAKTPNRENPGFDIADSNHEEQLYQTLARDRLAGELNGRVSENQLLRRYQVSRTLLARVLQRIEFDGWIESLPGHGWFFPAMQTSVKDYLDGYRFRAVIEPAAILDPEFTVDREQLKRCRRDHERLLDGGIDSATSQEIFEINKRLHETIIAGSHNSFFISSLKRVNGLRRLLEHAQTTDRTAALNATREHLEIIELLLADRRAEAAAALSRHLQAVSRARVRQHQGPQQD